ncbi:GntR family transcriptional regulator [Microbacterium saperdae]|uniref:GntR family transcriptional regulator n=1 Tax=Microbacterium saperdae TaxID=69368 RepID=A0A543B9S0_9MICO|nr:GntR family transcriptional regulator [Microbacterium saperdae]TQL81526.1 GntR family transcriptional regulator [Microbacterium saperdae]
MRPTRAPALGDQLAAVLRDRIVRRQLQPGTHLVEDAVAAEYDVSRGPVRDALRQLESQGLVEARRRGFFVVGLSESDINDLYELRESIELVAVTRAIAQASADQIRLGREIVREMVACADRSAAADFADADMRFHALLYRVGGNRRLVDVWEAYEPVFASLMQLTVEEDVDLHPSAHDHGRLLDLIEEGDAEKVRAELREHLDGARGRMTHAVQALIDVPSGEIAS